MPLRKSAREKRIGWMEDIPKFAIVVTVINSLSLERAAKKASVQFFFD